MMFCSDAIVVEDWEGLESEIERLLLTYGYPTEDESNNIPVVETEEFKDAARDRQDRQATQ